MKYSNKIISIIVFFLMSCEKQDEPSQIPWEPMYIIRAVDATNSQPIVGAKMSFRFSNQASDMQYEMFSDQNGSFIIKGEAVYTIIGGKCTYTLIIIHPPRKDGYQFVPQNPAVIQLFPESLPYTFENQRTLEHSYYLKVN